MLHPMPLGIIPFALGVSTALHAAVLLVPIAPPSPPSSVSAESIDVELFTDGASAAGATPIESTVGPSDAEAEPQQAVRSPLSPPNGFKGFKGFKSGHPSPPRMSTPSARVSADGEHPSSPVSIHEPGPALISGQTVDARARLERGAVPTYPDAARADGVEGEVRLELVVGTSGLVESARVVHGVGHGLDESALRAARDFRFAPASMGGYPVRVRMGWSIQFRLR